MHEAIIKPPAIKEGDTIKVVAPSSPLTTSAMKSNLSKAIDFLKRKGFKVDLSSSYTYLHNKILHCRRPYARRRA